MPRKQVDVRATIYDKKGRVLSVGENNYSKTHPLQAKYAKLAGLDEKIFLHAELSAIIKLKDPRKAFRITIERYSKNGNPMVAKPCPICEKAIKKETRIQVIEHT
jgi:deoxycytidylate deaminase